MQIKKIWIPATLFLTGTLFLIVNQIVELPFSNVVLPVILVITLLLFLRLPHEGKYRSFFLLLALFSIIRYLIWRTGISLTITSSATDNFCIFLLYAAEIYTLILLILGIFTSFSLPVSVKPVPLDKQADNYPVVDVYIPSYDEPINLLEATLIAATQLNYPKEKLRVFLLDDGSSQQKRQHYVESIRKKATSRYLKTQKLCQTLGITLLTRVNNQHAKAGNLNAALKKTQGELLLVLDADHLVAQDFLEKTVGFFLQDDNLAIVQTPHFFMNANPVEKNLQVFDQLCSENDLFYFVSQPGLNDWGASFFCGSGGLLRRSVLNQIGGFSHYSVTEDCATSLQIHAKGFKSLYLDQPLTAAFQPETLHSYIRQRVRWTQGMIQIFLLDNPLIKSGLTLAQRLCYLSTLFFWFFPFARLIFILLPLLYLIFDVQIYQSTSQDFFKFVLPHLFIIFLTADYLYGVTRKNLMSGLYELIQSPAAFLAILKTFLFPRSPRFHATPKQEIYNKDHLYPSRFFFYGLYALSVMGLLMGIWTYAREDNASWMMLIAFGWVLFNFFCLHGVIGALLERKQRRRFPRSCSIHSFSLQTAGEKFDCTLSDLSLTGALAYISSPSFSHSGDASFPVTLIATDHLSEFKTIKIDATAFIRKKEPHQKPCLALIFPLSTLDQKENSVLLNYAHSERWQHILNKKQKKHSLLWSGRYLASHVFTSFKDHVCMLIRSFFSHPPR